MVRLFLFLSIFSLSFPSFLSIAQQSNRWLKPFKKINKEVLRKSEAYSNLKIATETIGHRLTGSPNGTKAEELVYKTLQSYGFDVEYHPFEVETWFRDKVTISIAPKNSDDFKDGIEGVALAHSPLFANESAPIIDLGDGLEDDFIRLKDSIRDKIVLVNIDVRNDKNKENLHRSEKTALAIYCGAKGVLMVNGVPNNVLLTGTASVSGDIIPVPSVCISYESGEEIRNWLRAAPNLIGVIKMQNDSRKVNSRNIIATLPGQSEEEVVIAGHLDSWDLATGAIDNGIGSFAILDIARTFKTLKIKPEKTIKFIFFMGEEQGLLGSKAYVKQRKADSSLSKIRYMFNLDMTNDPRGFNDCGRKELVPLFSEVSEAIMKIDPQFQNKNNSVVKLHSDHHSFLLNGIPIIGMNGFLKKEVLNCYHANCDDFRWVDENELKNTVRFTGMLLYAIANTPNIPLLDSNQTRDFLIQNNLKQQLIIGKEWIWE